MVHKVFCDSEECIICNDKEDEDKSNKKEKVTGEESEKESEAG